MSQKNTFYINRTAKVGPPSGTMEKVHLSWSQRKEKKKERHGFLP
jgi:hypothetical protein